MFLARALADSAFALLEQALLHRRGLVWKEERNHASEHAPGALVMVVTTFDVWLTEFCVGADIWHPGLLLVAERSICDRYAELLEKFSLSQPAAGADLRALVDARDEIVHYKPRHLPNGALSPWIQALDDRGLLVRAPNQERGDFTLPQKLCSYALAYWAFSVVFECATHLASAALPDDRIMFVGGPAEWTFGPLRSFPAPDVLGKFDQTEALPQEQV